jgi:hypothetical protein
MSEQPAINLKYIRKVLHFIESGPKERFEMRTYYRFLDTKLVDQQYLHAQGFPDCGTQACFAGWGVLLQVSKDKWRQKAQDIRLHKPGFRESARKLFGFTEGEADFVFEGRSAEAIGYAKQLRELKRSINTVLAGRGMKQRVK